MKCVAGRAGEHRGSQAGFPALWLGRQHRFPGGCAAVSQLISAALALFFPKILPHSPVRAFCFPPSLMMLFQSHLFVPVLPRPAQHQLLAPHSHSLTSTNSAQIPWWPLQEQPKHLQRLSAGQNYWWFVRIRKILVLKQLRNSMEVHRNTTGPFKSHPRMLSQKEERFRVMPGRPSLSSAQSNADAPAISWLGVFGDE